jgi:hypothetical protein
MRASRGEALRPYRRYSSNAIPKPLSRLDFRLAGSRNRLNWVEKVEKEKRKNARKLRS